MKFAPLKLDGAYMIDLEKRQDSRGFFARQYCDAEFHDLGLNTRWVQMNTSHSIEKGIVRGMHFQRPPKAEIKMIRCIKGSVFDVIVDLRKGSPTFAEWYGAELSEENHTMLYIPTGFAHGFQTLTDKTELLYWHSEFYASDCEGGVNFSDPELQIAWPLEVSGISDRDQNLESLSKLELI